MSGVNKAGKPVAAQEVPKTKTDLSGAASPPPEPAAPPIPGESIKLTSKGKLGKDVELFGPPAPQEKTEKVVYSSPEGDVKLLATHDKNGPGVGIRIKF